MSLSGNLGFVSLDEVLRLITRSKQTGAVEVKGDRMHGRIHVGRSGISLATTFSNDTLTSHLARSGLVTGDQARQIASGSADLSSMAEQSRITALLREMSVEGLYQMGLMGTSFEVVPDETTPFGSPNPFDLEELLADSRKRFSEWEEVRAIVSDLDRQVRLQSELGDRLQVTLDKDSWQLVSQIGHGASIRELSEQIGTTEFWTARVAAGLVENDLMSLEAASLEAFEPDSEEPASAELAAAAEPHGTDEETSVAEKGETGEPEVETVEAETPAEMPVADAVTFTPESETGEVLADDEAAAGVAAAAASQSVDPNESWWKEPVTASKDEVVDSVFAEGTSEPASSEVEDDTETFLEKVFSELEPPGDAEEGYGLLRRRRMGAIRDTSSGS